MSAGELTETVAAGSRWPEVASETVPLIRPVCSPMARAGRGPAKSATTVTMRMRARFDVRMV
jgi:hypothetical protein